jgi:hypothetical protein
MTQTPFDAFSKEFLADLLAPFGTVERSFEVPGESKYIDLLFRPTEIVNSKEKGLLNQVISTPSVLEAYSNPPSSEDVSTCLLKLFWLREEITRKANAEKRKLIDNELPRLWILTPTLPEPLKKECALIRQTRRIPGVYRFPNAIIRTTIVSIKDLPRIPETLWLRVLGRGNTQANAILEVIALPLDDPRRATLLRMLCAWKIVTIETNPSIFESSEATTMAYPQVFLDWEAATEARGEARGAKDKALSIVLRLLNRRIGLLNESLETVVRQLPINQLDDLSEALLDFGSSADLDRWLTNHSNV